MDDGKEDTYRQREEKQVYIPQPALPEQLVKVIGLRIGCHIQESKK